MKGYALFSEDNESYAFRDDPELTEYQQHHQELVPDMSGASRLGVQRCETCGELLAKWDEPLTGLMIVKRRYDISVTYDGVAVVKEKFKSTIELNNLAGLVFAALPDDPQFFEIRATKTVAFDAERRKTRFLKPCAICGRYESVVGATPVFLKTAIPDRGFVRTDLEFGSGDEKSPLILCGETAGRVLENAKLKGLDLEPLG